MAYNKRSNGSRDQAMRYTDKLEETGIEWEFHIYQQGSHGLSVAISNQQQRIDIYLSWLKLAVEWLKDNKVYLQA